MDPFPLPETTRYNLVLNLPKLLAGEVVMSEISDDPRSYPSFWEERIKAVTAILEIEAKESRAFHRRPMVDLDRAQSRHAGSPTDHHCLPTAHSFWLI